MRKKFTIQKVELMERRLEKLNSIIEECKREREDGKYKLEEEKIEKRTIEELGIVNVWNNSDKSLTKI